MSETQLDAAASGTTAPDAETGEADEVSEYSEEADGLDAAGPADDAAISADDVAPVPGDAEESLDDVLADLSWPRTV